MNQKLKILKMPQLIFICGKGGVGKSMYACFLAKKLSKEKKNTLLIQVNAKDSHCHILNSKPITAQIKAIESYLWAVNVTPQDSLQEYLLLKVSSKRMYRLVFDNALMRSFLRFVPSLAELNMLGKIWYHAEERDDDENPRYEHIVVDCPATGHGFRFLKVARVTYEGVKKGVIANEAFIIAKTLENPRRTGLHLVTLPEELPVNESLEFIKNIKESKMIALHRIVANTCLKNIFDDKAGHDLIMSKDLRPKLREILNCCLRRSKEEKLQKIQLERLFEAIPEINFLQLPYVSSADEKDILDELLRSAT